MKGTVYSIKGEKEGELELPAQFSEDYQPVIITRAFNANMSQTYMHKGLDIFAGFKHVTRTSKRRRKFRTTYGYGISRTPRKMMSRRGTRFNWVSTLAPNTRGGRVAHPPMVEKVFEDKINRKENLLAIRSAIAATINKKLVSERGHKFEAANFPLIIDGAEKISKTKEVKQLLEKIGLGKDLERSSKKTLRSGVGKMRGRKYSTRKGPLIITSAKNPLLKAALGLQGVEAIPVNNLNVTMLAPGGKAGRLTVWTKEAINVLSQKKLFTGEKA
ncbi:50S ribosomal protein L4 [Candidatus Tiddalikarchaeum anstoanum]|nr:50S ribosomal protein L4 [Candidatus Tiddalikarchaeum anstoanum]